MTISVGTPSSDSDEGTLSVTFSHTTVAAKGKQLLVGVSFNNDGFEVVSTVTFNGVSLSLVIAHDTDDDSRVELWRLQDPPVGTFDVVVTLDSTPTSTAGFVCGAVQFSEVDSVTPVGATASNDGDSAANSVTVSSNAGEVAIEVSGLENDTFTTPGAGQTTLWNILAGTDPKEQSGASSYKAGASPNVTLSWTNTDDKWSMLAASFRPSVVPTVDAGGPYSGDVSTTIPLDATVTPGTDPSPALTWTIDSGPGGGVFTPSANVEDPSFNADTVGAYVLRLTAVTVDAPDVFDTANFESKAVAPIVDAGGPYNGDVDTATALNGTVTPGSDPTPVLLWTIDSGPGGGVFSNDSIEDPLFTPDTVGSYVLKLEASPSDSTPVSDTASFESDDVPPVVDAGANILDGIKLAARTLDGSVTPGSDPSPTILWTIDVDGFTPPGGSFLDDSDPTTDFTPNGTGGSLLKLTATPSDGPPVEDTMVFAVPAVPPTVDAGGMYSGTVDTPIALDATITPGTGTIDSIEWSVISGGGGVFSPSAFVEDPTFTPSNVGAFTLQIEVDPSDGAPVTDTASLQSTPIGPSGPVTYLAGFALTDEGLLIAERLDIGESPPAGNVQYLAGSAVNNNGVLYFYEDDGLIDRVFINGLPHSHEGVRILTADAPEVVLAGWGLTNAEAQSAQGTTTVEQFNKGIGVLNDSALAGVEVTPPTDEPPAAANLVHWFDFTDTGVLFQDVAGTIPVTADAQIIRNIANKGSSTSRPVQAGTAPTWNSSSLNGKGAGKFKAQTLAGLMNESNDGNRTIAMIFKPNSLAAAAEQFDVFKWGPQVRGYYRGQGAPDPNIIVFQQQAGLVNTEVAPFAGESYWALNAASVPVVPGNMTYDAAAGARKTVFQNVATIAANQTLTLGSVEAASDTDILEVFIWDKRLNDTEFDEFEAYADGRYTVLPLTPQPMLIEDLVHWFDFTDSTVLWQDVAGTIAIVDGTDILRVDDKGYAGVDFIDSFPPGPIWRTNLINGLAGTESVSGFPANLQMTGWANGSGAASLKGVFAVARATYTGGFPNNLFLASAAPGVIGVEADEFSTGDWAGNLTNEPQPTSTGRAITLNEWVMVAAGGNAPSSDNFYRASGTSEVILTGPYVAPGSPTNPTLAQMSGNCMEVLVYDNLFEAVERQAQEDNYFNRRYGVLPHS